VGFSLTLSLDNVASLRLWDTLGFNRVGLIPKAGRLKTGPNGEDEYYDAVIIHKSFVGDDGNIHVPDH
jgi:L-amino acid N-acyltransferase YncA